MHQASLVAATLLALLGCSTGVRADKTKVPPGSTVKAAGPLWKESAPAPAAQLAGFDPRESLAPLIKKIKPAVVNVKVTKVMRQPAHGFGPFGHDPRGPEREEFFERVFGRPGPWPRGERPPRPPREREFRAHGQGSGFIVSAEGHVLTNHHVVAEADEVTVTLADEREFEAEVAARDPRADLAILKLRGDGANDLPTVVLGDSNAIEVGDWVIAIGNPFGLAHTVTVGIVSAKPKLVGQACAGGECPLDDYIQTDAAINPGNSGGPLFNGRGEVIGINSFIVTQGVPQSAGVGFALPINVARSALQSFGSTGRIARGKLGVMIGPVEKGLADKVGLGKPRGALVSGVEPDGAGARAGAQAGDIILEFDGRTIEDHAEVPRVVSDTLPGKEVSIVVWRDGNKRTLRAKLGEWSGDGAETASAPGEPGRDPLGIEVGPAGGEGVEVTDPGDGPAARFLQRGDRIVELDGRRIAGVDDYRAAVAKLRKGETVTVKAHRGNILMFFAIPLQ